MISHVSVQMCLNVWTFGNTISTTGTILATILTVVVGNANFFHTGNYWFAHFYFENFFYCFETVVFVYVGVPKKRRSNVIKCGAVWLFKTISSIYWRVYWPPLLATSGELLLCLNLGKKICTMWLSACLANLLQTRKPSLKIFIAAVVDTLFSN